MNTEKIDLTEWLTVEAAAAYLGTSDHTVRRYSYEGLVERVKHNGRWRYRRADLATIERCYPKGDGGRRRFGASNTVSPYVHRRINAGRDTYVVTYVQEDGTRTSRTFRTQRGAERFRDRMYGEGGGTAPAVTVTAPAGIMARLRAWWRSITAPSTEPATENQG